MDNGHIKIHRKIRDHWIWRNEKYFYAWTHMLMKAAWKDHDELIGSTIIPIKRGQFISGVKSLSRDTSLSLKQARTFVDRLIKEEMICREVGLKWAVITICNYDLYNPQGQSKGNLRAIKGQQLKKGNKGKNVNLKEKYIKENCSNGFSTPEFVEAWCSFVDHRQDIKKPLTERAAEIQLNKLKEWGVEKSIASINTSIGSRYSDLYKPKDFKSNNAFTGKHVPDTDPEILKNTLVINVDDEEN